MIARRAKISVLLALIAWAALAFWNSVKPLPTGTHVASLAARLSESDAVVTFNSKSHREILAGELAAIDRAEQMIVIDQSPISREVAQHLLMRKRQRPNLKLVLVADPLDEAYGGTRAQYLAELEEIGIIVARVRLNRLRDPNALFSSLWRLSVAWWSDPFDEEPGVISLRSLLRRQNFKGDHRQLMVADDGSGAWRSWITGPADSDVGLELHGGLARDIAASELQIAAWSTGDDRLPSAPPSEGRGLGSIDARFLTEGAIRSALLDSMATAGSGDEIGFAVNTLSDRPLINAALGAAARGARLKILLDPEAVPNRTVARELTRDGDGQIEVHWFSPNEAAHSTLGLVRRGGELTAFLGAMNFTRPSLEDFNLEATIELRMPARAAAARLLTEHFAAEWSIATGYAQYADDSQTRYWRYRLLGALGLAAF